jgi:hypothetical protein
VEVELAAGLDQLGAEGRAAPAGRDLDVHRVVQPGDRAAEIDVRRQRQQAIRHRAHQLGLAGRSAHLHDQLRRVGASHRRRHPRPDPEGPGRARARGDHRRRRVQHRDRRVGQTALLGARLDGSLEREGWDVDAGDAHGKPLTALV